MCQFLTLEGPDFQQSDLEFVSMGHLKTITEVLRLSKSGPQQRQQAQSELYECFAIKLMRTYLDLPGFPSPTAMSKKLVKVPIHVIRCDEEPPVAEETFKLPHGTITLSRVDTKFCSEMIEGYTERLQNDWMKLRPWVCDMCGAPSSQLVTQFSATVSHDAPIDAPMRLYIFPVCGNKKCTLLL